MADRPLRLQLSRRKGFDLQALSLATNGLPAVNCARPGPLGNPFIVGQDGTAAECASLLGNLVVGRLALTARVSIACQLAAMKRIRARLADLRGKNLACWCPPGQPCHADVLLEMANG